MSFLQFPVVFYTSQSLFLGVIVLAKRLRSSYLKRTTLSVFCTRLSSYSFSLSWKKRSNKWIDVNWCIPVAEETKLWNINNMPNLFSFLFYKQWFIRSLPQPKGSVVRTCCLKDKKILTENYHTLLYFVNTKLPAILSHRCSTTVSLEIYLLYYTD